MYQFIYGSENQMYMSQLLKNVFL